MINLADDELILTSPAVDSALQQCAAAYRREWLPRILAEDPPAVLAQMLQAGFSWVSEEERQAAVRRVAALTPDRVEAEFSQEVSSRIDTDGARLAICFQRTLRLPDDGNTYPLPPGLGRFPLRSIGPYASRLPASWTSRGGVLMPIHQAEALWLRFHTGYGWALKVGTGLLNAVNARPWEPGLLRQPQSYVVLPEQPWLDGYCTGEGVISQFVAARMGQGYTAAEQLLSTAAGGLQLEAFPLKPEAWFAKRLQNRLPKSCADLLARIVPELAPRRDRFLYRLTGSSPTMGLGAGGKMKQKIYQDPWEPEDWDLASPSRLWVHLCDAAAWFHITGALPPQEPFTAQEYAASGLPWFDYYGEDLAALKASPFFARLKSVFALAKEKGDPTIPQEETVLPGPVVPLGPQAPAGVIAEWDGQ